MHDELTKQDIQKMKEELEHRRKELLPEQLEEVKRTRAFGDLSENYEYKTAKQEVGVSEYGRNVPRNRAQGVARRGRAS